MFDRVSTCMQPHETTQERSVYETIPVPFVEVYIIVISDHYSALVIKMISTAKKVIGKTTIDSQWQLLTGDGGSWLDFLSHQRCAAIFAILTYY